MPQAESHGGQIYPQPARSAHRCSSPFHTATSPSATGAQERACAKFKVRSRVSLSNPAAHSNDLGAEALRKKRNKRKKHPRGHRMNHVGLPDSGGEFTDG